MTLTQLRTFLAIADTGSVHAAADQLFVTQSAVSASATALQRSLGIQLIRRDGRGLRLSEAGVVYADYIRRVLGLLDEAGTAAAAEADPERGLLRMAALTTAGEQILPRVLASFRQRHPQVGIKLEVGNRERVRTLLDRHEVDLLLGGRPSPGREVAVLGVRPHELIIVAAEVPFTAPDEHDILEWVEAQTWLLREKGSGTRETTEQFLATQDPSHPPRTLTVGSNAAIRESVVAGLGVTLISRDAVARELDEGRVVEVPLPGTPLPRDWHLTANPGVLPATALALVTHVLTTGEFQPPRQRAEGALQPSSTQ
ncbi:MAG: LysR family transcriptional regulator [Pseudonocardiaceae bacterium]